MAGTQVRYDLDQPLSELSHISPKPGKLRYMVPNRTVSGSYLLRTLLGVAMLGVANAGMTDGVRIIGVYENCSFRNVTVVVQNPTVAHHVSVEAEIAAAGKSSFDQASTAARQVLENYGIKDVTLEQRGYSGCARPASGKFVEAVGMYCDGKLVRAEILVDGKVFASRTDQRLSLDDFVGRQRKRLQAQGIVEEPKITVQNDQNCAPPQTS